VQAPSIDIHHLNLSYHGRPLFKNFGLTFPANKCISILGQSGVGKSTILRLLAHLITGVDEENFQTEISVSNHIPIIDQIAYMGQQDFLMPWLSILDNVLLGYRLRHQHIDEAIKKEAIKLLKDMGLTHAMHQQPKTLSGGMKQRAALARTFIEQQPIILMDEPFSALDTVTRYRLQELATKLFQNKTVILVTHDPLEALRLSDIIHVLSGIPAKITETIEPQSNKPRDIHDEKILHLHAHLIEELNKTYENFDDND